MPDTKFERKEFHEIEFRGKIYIVGKEALTAHYIVLQGSGAPLPIVVKVKWHDATKGKTVSVSIVTRSEVAIGVYTGEVPPDKSSTHPVM